MAACDNGLTEIARLMVERGADVEQEMRTEREQAYIRIAGSRVVRQLLDLGADVGQVDEDGASLLWTACKKGRLDVAQLLIERGANVAQVANSAEFMEKFKKNEL